MLVNVPVDLVICWYPRSYQCQRTPGAIDGIKGALTPRSHLNGIAAFHSSLYLVKELQCFSREHSTHLAKKFVHLCCKIDFSSRHELLIRGNATELLIAHIGAGRVSGKQFPEILYRDVHIVVLLARHCPCSKQLPGS